MDSHNSYFPVLVIVVKKNGTEKSVEPVPSPCWRYSSLILFQSRHWKWFLSDEHCFPEENPLKYVWHWVGSLQHVWQTIWQAACRLPQSACLTEAVSGRLLVKCKRPQSACLIQAVSGSLNQHVWQAVWQATCKQPQSAFLDKCCVSKQPHSAAASSCNCFLPLPVSSFGRGVQPGHGTWPGTSQMHCLANV